MERHIAMDVILQLYTDDYKEDIVQCIAQFFGFHMGLSSGNTIGNIDTNVAEQNLKDWTTRDNQLYVIVYANVVVGFLRIGYRGGNVAWIEDVFVKEDFRNRGIATESIRQAERIIKNTPPYNAVCFDVVPRNMDAIKLYHKLGYQTLSLVTVRKDFVPKESTDTETINGCGKSCQGTSEMRR